MARGKQVFVVFYDNNDPEVLGRFRLIRCAVFDSFWKAHENLGKEIDYLYNKGGHIEHEWYNDESISDATCASFSVRLPDGELMNMNIVPSYIN